MAALIFFLLSSFVAIVLGGVPQYTSVDYQGYNNIEDYGQYSHYAHSLPAYSTVSYLMSNGHKPVSYSGFTNHGRGHHDPGYAVLHRQEGFQNSHDSHNSHYY